MEDYPNPQTLVAQGFQAFHIPGFNDGPPCPKPPALPTAPHPGMNMKFCFEVANMWYETHLRGFCESRKTAFSLEYQGFQRLPKNRADSVLRSPKAGALPTALHPVIELFYPAGRILPKNALRAAPHSEIIFYISNYFFISNNLYIIWSSNWQI